MAVKRVLHRAISPVLELLAPQACWAGGEGDAAFGLSESKRIDIAALAAQPYCHHCGLTVGPFESHDAKNPCARCGTRDVGVAHIARVGTFEEPLVTLVHQLKFGRSWELAGILAPVLYQAMTRVAEVTATPVDVMVPVPLHWRRRAKRGFNQAEELTRQVATLSGWRHLSALRRTRATVEQARTRSATHRLENLRGAFECLRDSYSLLAGRHVWLVDDVSTTGATLHAAASALRQLPRGQKPASINAAVICITDHRSPPHTVA